MRRIAVLVAMVVPLSLFAAGCGGAGSSSSSTPKTEAEKAEKMKMMKAQGAKMMSQMKDKGAGVPDKTPTPEK